MKLSYRGVQYEQDSLALEMNEGEIGGKYRGQDWQYHYPRHIPQLQPKLYRQYRGVAYSSRPHFHSESKIQACSIPRTEPTIVIADEVGQIHLETIRRRLERRLEIALGKGDLELVRLLREESSALKLNIV